MAKSLNHPGGNATGISILTAGLNGKRFGLLRDLVPKASLIALLVNPNNVNTESVIRYAQNAARTKGVQLPVLRAGTEGEIDAAFASLAQLQADGLVVAGDQFFTQQREQVVALASRYSVPATYDLRGFTAAGGLINYGQDNRTVPRQAGVYAGRILKGEKPADLPVEQPVKFDLVINMKTAKALGLTVPPLLLATADEVIE